MTLDVQQSTLILSVFRVVKTKSSPSLTSHAALKIGTCVHPFPFKILYTIFMNSASWRFKMKSLRLRACPRRAVVFLSFDCRLMPADYRLAIAAAPPPAAAANNKRCVLAG